MNFWTSYKLQKALNEAPYIFPYFFDLKKINLFWKGQNLTIKNVADDKLQMWSYCYFETSSNKIIGAINFWTYFKQVTNTLFYCYLKRNPDDPKPKAIVSVYLFSTDNLNTIENFEMHATEMKEKNLPFVFETKISELAIPMDMELGINGFTFPDEYKTIDEIILFSTKEGLYDDQPKDIYWADHVLIILRPKKNEVEIISLDWFNKSGDDFGYVWPTRIARSKFDNRMYGQGIRMENFILDPTGKQKIDV